MFLHFFSRFRRGSPQWRKEREVWGGESGVRLKLVCGRGWRGGRFVCGDGGMGCFLLRVDVEGCFKCNGRGTDKKQKRSHETEMTRSR